jgi:hypothetical protein
MHDKMRHLPSIDGRTNRAVAHVQYGRASAYLEINATPCGLLAVGALVAGILLSVAPVVKAATRHLRARGAD